MHGQSFSQFMKALKNVEPQYTLLLPFLLEYSEACLLDSVEGKKRGLSFYPVNSFEYVKEEHPTALNISLHKEKNKNYFFIFFFPNSVFA